MRQSAVRLLVAAPSAAKYNAVIVGGGHNGLTAAAYLAKAGRRVCVLERRHVLGGAAVTEEIVPGFRFSRASYLLSLLRPAVINELQLKEHGLRYYIRNPSSFTPIRDSRRSLLLGMDVSENLRQIANFSAKDAENYLKYEHAMGEIVKCIEKLMDLAPIDVDHPSSIHKLKKVLEFVRIVRPLGYRGALDLFELLTSPISKVMNKWFESDVLKATLGTDGVIGFAASPFDAGTGYRLIRLISYSFSLPEVNEILLDGEGVARGVRLWSGREIAADAVLAATTPAVAFQKLVPQEKLPADFRQTISSIDYTSPVTKINVAVRELPNFTALPHSGRAAAPHHQTTIHMNSESMDIVHQAVVDFRAGRASRRPLIEMTIPSSVDRSIVDGDGHVVLLFTQYTHYLPADGPWTEKTKQEYAKRVVSDIDAYAPNFSSSVVDYEVLTPPDLEQTFGLTGGNIFHGSMSLDQLYWLRPAAGFANFSTPIRGLFLAASGAHPGGGVCGAPGRLAAMRVLNQI